MVSATSLLVAPVESLRVAARVARVAAHTAGHLSWWYADDALAGVTWSHREAHVRRWSSLLLEDLGVRVLADTPALPTTSAGRMVVSNHRSMLDVLLLLSHFGGHMLSRADLAGWPLIGPLARKSETLFVDRDSAASGTAAVRTMTECLRQGRTVAVFPEGTTYRGDEVRAFHAGAFVAAATAGCEVLPVGVAYESAAAEYFHESFGDHLGRVVRASETRVGLAVGAPIAATGMRAKRLLDASHEAVRACVAKARETVGPYAG